MGINLEKGSKVDLHKASQDAGATAPLTKVIAGAGWDKKGTTDIDLDLMSVYIGTDGKAIADANGNGTNLDEAVTFYMNAEGNKDNNPALPGALHKGDNLTGEGEGDDEQIVFTLADIPAEVAEIAVLVLAYSEGISFSDVDNVKVRMVNADGNTEIAAFSNSDLGSGHAVEVGRLTRNADKWEFTAKGELLSVADGKSGADVVKAVLESYGVSGL